MAILETEALTRRFDKITTVDALCALMVVGGVSTYGIGLGNLVGGYDAANHTGRTVVSEGSDLVSSTNWSPITYLSQGFAKEVLSWQMSNKS